MVDLSELYEKEFGENRYETEETPKWLTIRDFMEKDNDLQQLIYCINDILETFDYKKIHDVMVYLNWTWATLHCGSSVPTEEEFKAQLKDMLFKLFEEGYEENEDSYMISTGGITVEYQVLQESQDSGELCFSNRVCVKAYFAVDNYCSLW